MKYTYRFDKKKKKYNLKKIRHEWQRIREFKKELDEGYRRSIDKE